MSTEDTRLDQRLDRDGVLVLSGEIDSYTAPALAERLTSDPLLEVVDLSAITFIDSTGLRTLLQAQSTRREDGSRFVLRAPSAPVQRLLEISGLAGHFDVTA
jgi:anti-sigma B factor antagonist